MVTSYNGSAVLKTYRLNSDGEKSYILGFPYIVNSSNKHKDVGYTKFSKDVIKNIKEMTKTRGTPDIIVAQAANNATESNSWNFEKSKLQDGFFFPKSASKAPGDIEKVRDFLTANELVTIRYLSARVGASGNPTLIEKIYIGRFTGISEDEKIATLQIGDSDHRSFHIDQILALACYDDKLSDGEVLYLHVQLSPNAKGGTLLTWSTLRGENHPLLAQPFHKNIESPKRDELLGKSSVSKEGNGSGKANPAPKKKQEKTFSEFLIPREGEVDWDGLEKHLGKFVRVEIYSKDFHEATHYFKLRKMVYTPEYKRLLLEGERVNIEQPIHNLVIASVKRKK